MLIVRWPNRPKDAPKWPTLRGADGSDENVERIVKTLQEAPNCIAVARGTHKVRLTPNGGICSFGGTLTEFPTVHFELQFFTKGQDERQRKVVYWIGWIGFYGKGAIFHGGWQFPHFTECFEPDLIKNAFEAYSQIATIVYNGNIVEREVNKFISESSLVAGGTQCQK